MSLRRYALDLRVVYETDGPEEWVGWRVGHDLHDRITELFRVDLHDQWARRHATLDDEPVIRATGPIAWQVHEIHEVPS